MSEQHNPQLYDQALEVQSNVPTSHELIDGWANAEVAGNNDQSQVYKKALEGHLEGAIEDGMIDSSSLDDHIEAIHTAQANKVNELKAKIEAESKAAELDEALPKDEFDGAYSSLGNRHTYLKTADGKNRQVSRAVAMAKAENKNAEAGLDESAAESFNLLRNELNEAGERGVSDEKFIEIAETLWDTARRQARQSGSTELMRAVKEQIYRSDHERSSVIARRDQSSDNSNHFAAPNAEDKVSIKKLMEDNPKLDFHPNSDRPRAITQAEFKQFNKDTRGDDNTKSVDQTPQPAADSEIKGQYSLQDLQDAATELALAEQNNNQASRTEALARIKLIVDQIKASGLMEPEEVNNLIDEVIKQGKVRIQRAAGAPRHVDHDANNQPDSPDQDDIDAVVAADEPGADEETRKKGLLARARLAGYSLATLPFKLKNRERSTGEPMTRRRKVGLALGGMAAVLGVAYVAHRTGVFDAETIANTSPDLGESASSDNLSEAAELLGNNQAVESSDSLNEAAGLLSGGQPEGPSPEAIQQVNEAISNRTNEILNAPGEHLWDKANSIYGDQATPRLIDAVDELKSQGVDIGWTENPETSKTAAIVFNGSQSQEATMQAWEQISNILAQEEMERFFDNAKKNK